MSYLWFRRFISVEMPGSCLSYLALHRQAEQIYVLFGQLVGEAESGHIILKLYVWAQVFFMLLMHL